MTIGVWTDVAVHVVLVALGAGVGDWEGELKLCRRRSRIDRTRGRQCYSLSSQQSEMHLAKWIELTGTRGGGDGPNAWEADCANLPNVSCGFPGQAWGGGVNCTVGRIKARSFTALIRLIAPLLIAFSVGSMADLIRSNACSESGPLRANPVSFPSLPPPAWPYVTFYTYRRYPTTRAPARRSATSLGREE